MGKNITEMDEHNEIQEVDNIFKIPAMNLQKLEDKISELQKKAEKLGSSPISITVMGQKVISDKNGKNLYYIVKIDGEAPKLKGWKLIGILDHDGGTPLIRTVPGEVVPPEYRKASNYCDYCRTNRYRIVTYILQSDQGIYKQVGSNCIKDFLGGTDPKVFASMASCLRDIMVTAESLQNYDGGIGGTPSHLPTSYYLAWCVAIIKKYGFVSKAKSSENNPSTTERVHKNLFSGNTIQGHEKIEADEGDFEKANVILGFIKEHIGEKEKSGSQISDFEHNLLGLANRNIYDYRYAGFIAAMVPYYERETEKKNVKNQEQHGPTNKSQHLGKEGEKIQANVTVNFVTSRETTYGLTFIVNMIDDSGNKLTWFASKDPSMHKGKKYRIQGTIKSLGEYQGEKSTVITRCKVMSEL